MKYLPSTASFLSCLATAACLSFPLASASAADHYRKETHGPRIGSRILYFVADVATLQNPNDRYRHLPKNQQRYQQQQQQRQKDPGIRPPGQRFSLDRPPMPNEPAPQRPPQMDAPEQDAPPRNSPPPRDMPYETQEAPPSDEREKRPSTVGSQKHEETPSVKVKPKATPPAPKPAPSPKAQVEEAPPEPPAPKQEATPPSTPTPPKETLTASNNTASSKKSWQSFSNENPTTSTPAPTPAPAPKPAVENHPAPTAPVTPNGATLTGSKTSKEGRVKSPYPPYNELDVTGLPAGSLAMDPTTGKVFRVP